MRLTHVQKKGLTPNFLRIEDCPDLDTMHEKQEAWIKFHRNNCEDLLNILDATPMRAVLVTLCNDYIIHDGQRWRTETVIKSATIKKTGAWDLGAVFAYDCEPNEDEFFERYGQRWLTDTAGSNLPC